MNFFNRRLFSLRWHQPRCWVRLLLLFCLLTIGLIGHLFLSFRSHAAETTTNAPEQINAPDSIVTIGNATGSGTPYYPLSLALDSAGRPVITWWENRNILMVDRCDDVNCTSPIGFAGTQDFGIAADASLILDAAGFPIVSYYDIVNFNLKLLRCNDALCQNGDESITSPETMLNIGKYSSLALDPNNRPVISYIDVSNRRVRLMHCNDAKCAGNNETINGLDGADEVTGDTALALDAAGRPILAYIGSPLARLKIIHCNDVNCANRDEVINTPDPNNVATGGISLRLDSSGNPVVSYYSGVNGTLKIMHCNDVNCAGNDESITTPDPGTKAGQANSLRLDSAGNPVVSYDDGTNRDLKVLHCNDVNCAGNNESITSPDTSGIVGEFSSLALDSAGNPVVSYSANGTIKLLHCGSATCSDNLSVAIYLSSRDAFNPNNTTIFADEDIMVYNTSNLTWGGFFDGSDVLSRTLDLDGFAFLPNGDIAMSFDLTRTVTGLGEVLPADVVRFTPTSLGFGTQGSFAWLLDGSDVGLDGPAEDIDSVALTPDGRLVVSTRGNYAVPGLSGEDEDLIVLDNAVWGINSSGVWHTYFDGTDVGLINGDEDVRAAFIDASASKIYLTTAGPYSVTGLRGDADDIFVCTVVTLGDSTSCTFSLFLDGTTIGMLGQHIDGLVIGDASQIPTLQGSALDNDEDGTVGDEYAPADPDDLPQEEEQEQRVYLPLINQ